MPPSPSTTIALEYHGAERFAAPARAGAPAIAAPAPRSWFADRPASYALRLSPAHPSANQTAMATDPARITTPERTAEDVDQALRPKSLHDFIGQQGAREQSREFV